MCRCGYLVAFMLKNYWRTVHGILEAVILGIFAGIVFDPRWAPYTHDYIVLGKQVFLLLTGVLVSFRLSRIHYAGSLTILLGRVSRKGYYLASLTVSVLVTVLFGICLDLDLLAVARVQPGILFSLPLLAGSLLNVILTVAVTHLFTVYLVKNDLTRLLAVVAVGLAAMPEWYRGLPLERLWQYGAYLLPPLSRTIDGFMRQSLGIGPLLHAGLYSFVIIGLGMYLFGRRSLTDLYY